MTPADIYARYTGRLWHMWNDRQRTQLREAFPDTDGSPHLVSNWHRGDPTADRLLSWDGWHRIRARFDREYERADHIHNHNRHFRPLWCARCKAGAS